MKKAIKRFLQDINPKQCKFCPEKAVVMCDTYEGKKIYLCPNCLRGFRFQEEIYFKSVLPYGSY